jgi:hypothetical protein
LSKKIFVQNLALLSVSVVPQALRRLTTLARSFSIKHFLKRFALRCLITLLPGVFDQTFFEKACAQAILKKACGTRVVALYSH